MTVAEKRKKLREYCLNRGCGNCLIYERCSELEGCYNSKISDEDINKNFEIIFGKEFIKNTKPDRHVEVINKEDIIDLICDGENIIRINLDNMTCCKLEDKSIGTIRRDLQKDCYIYLVVDNYESTPVK